MGKSQFDEPMTFAKWWAIRSSALLELKLTPAQWYEKFAGQNIDSGGTPQLMLDTSGRITEASASATLVNLQYNTTATVSSTPKTFKAMTGIASSDLYHRKRYFQTTLTATAGGEIVAADVGPGTLAGYQACMIITHVYSDQTIANATTAFTASAGGLAVGLASLDISTTANAINPDWSPGLAWQADTDAATLQVSAAAGQYGNAQAVTFCGVYWYET